MKIFTINTVLLWILLLSGTIHGRPTLWTYFERLARRAMAGAQRLDLKRDTKINFSFPNTKWCGPGNTAQTYDDLGDDWETDQCCRDHDHCEINIGQGNEVCGVHNQGLFAISSCSCDAMFRQCLQSVGSKRPSSARWVARIYSTSVQQCVIKDPDTNLCQIVNRPF